MMEHQRPDVPCVTCKRPTHWTERTYVTLSEDFHGPYCCDGCLEAAYPGMGVFRELYELEPA